MSTDAISDASAPAGSSPDAGANSDDNPIRRGVAAAREQAQEVSEAMNEKLADLGAAAKRTGEKARDYAREQGEKARDYAREQGAPARDFAREQYEVRAEQMRRG